MDGNDIGRIGSSADLRVTAEHAAKRLAEQLALDVVAYDRTGSSLYLKRIRGLPAHQHDWPEWLWERFIEGDDSAGIDDDDLDAMRAPFCAEAALRLDEAGFDCR